MFKLYCFLQTSEPAGTDLFVANGTHASQLVRELCPRATGYVQTRALSEQIGEREASYAASAELYFTDADALLATLGSAESLKPLWNHATVQLAATMGGLVRTVIRTPQHHQTPGIKAVFPFRRREGMSVTAFQAHWWHRHGPIAAATESALFYPQCHALPECYADNAQPDYDGVTELHWVDLASAQAAMASEQMRVDQSNDAKNFAAPDVGIYLAQEEVIIAP